MLDYLSLTINCIACNMFDCLQSPMLQPQWENARNVYNGPHSYFCMDKVFTIIIIQLSAKYIKDKFESQKK